MHQILILLQGLAYSGLVIVLLKNRLARSQAGAKPILMATGALALLHGAITFAIPPALAPTWLFFRVPGHIITPLVLLWMLRRKE